MEMGGLEDLANMVLGAMIAGALILSLVAAIQGVQSAGRLRDNFTAVVWGFTAGMATFAFACLVMFAVPDLLALVSLSVVVWAPLTAFLVAKKCSIRW